MRTNIGLVVTGHARAAAVTLGGDDRFKEVLRFAPQPRGTAE